LAYYAELQQIPGFEVMPVGVAKRMLADSRMDPRSAEDFQTLARMMGVDAVVVGSVTEYSPYYPPRVGLSVRWYAANPGFHPIPAGYGLPWGTSEEEFIPDALVFDAEFELAREQLKTQTPEFSLVQVEPAVRSESTASQLPASQSPASQLSANQPSLPEELNLPEGVANSVHPSQPSRADASGPTPAASDLPLDWPDPRGFVPPPPRPTRPPCLPQHEPILRHTRLYQGNDAELAKRLANYYYFRDDARFGGWQAYLQRSDDFIRFCCYLHITEMLAARGGAGKTRVVWRWPIGRYER